MIKIRKFLILKNEGIIQNNKIIQLQKLENTMKYFKEKCEEKELLNTKATTFEFSLEELKKKVNESEKKNENLSNLLEKSKGKLSEEKNYSINIEMNLIKKISEIERLKKQRNNLKASFEKKEEVIKDLTLKIDNLIKGPSLGDSCRIKKPFIEKVTLQNEFDEAIKNLENQIQNKILSSEKKILSYLYYNIFKRRIFI